MGKYAKVSNNANWLVCGSCGVIQSLQSFCEAIGCSICISRALVGTRKNPLCAACWLRQPEPDLCRSCCSGLFGKLNIVRCLTCRQYYPAMQLASGRCHECSTRHAVIASLPRDNYDRYEIAERDAWTCGICGESIDRLLTDWIDPGYLNVDHIIPVTHPNFPGDLRSNVQASHRICNITKGGFKKNAGRK